MTKDSIFDPSFAPAYLDMATRLKLHDPLDLVGVAANESGLRAEAHNADGNASGLWQLMPATAKLLGWDPVDCAGADGAAPLTRFRALSATEQLPWFEKYFQPASGRLVSRAACYVWTFMPADIGLAADPSAIIVDKSELDPTEWRRGWAYSSNAGFDMNHDSRISVSELDDAIARNAKGARWDALARSLGQPPSSVVVAPFDLRTTLGVQEALDRLGYPHGRDDGEVGPLTRAAVASFQRDHQLAADGIPGLMTRGSLALALKAAA